MNLELEGKHAVITGASQGLGFACAQQLAAEGCRLTIGARRQRQLKYASKEIEAETGSKVERFSIDFMNPSTISKFVGNFATSKLRAQILILSGGGPSPGSVIALKDSDWREAFRLILLGPLRLVRELAPFMDPFSAITFVGAAGIRTPLRNSVLSNSMRAGLVVAAKLLSQELAVSKIRVNVVLPGPFSTSRLLELARSWAEGQDVTIEVAIAERYLQELSVDGLGNPEEFGKLVAFLSSPKASFITGATITIDGGFSKALL